MFSFLSAVKAEMVRFVLVSAALGEVSSRARKSVGGGEHRRNMEEGRVYKCFFCRRNASFFSLVCQCDVQMWSRYVGRWM